MTEIENLLIQYNVDSRNTRLRDYYEADNLWRALGIEREENRHSAFLAWLLEKDETHTSSPFLKFINLVLMRNKSICPDYVKLKSSVLSGRLKLKSVSCSVEKVISSLTRIRYNDRLDIYVDCEIDGLNGYSKIELFLENKIDATEGNSKVKGKIVTPTPNEVHYCKLKQSERYYYACSKGSQLRKAPFKPAETIQLFVYLTAKPQNTPADKHFIVITYQDLVDYVLEPYLDRVDLDMHTSMSVREYLRILGNPINNTTTMATTSEEKDLLLDFYKRNEDLFKRALEVMRDNAESEEEEKNYSAMLDSIKRSHARRYFSINGDKEYKMYEVVAEFVKYLLARNQSIDQIEKIIADCTKESRTHVSLDKTKVFRSEKCYEAQYEGGVFYVTKEWGLGKPGKNFDGLQKGINQRYSDFVIQLL